MITGSQSVADAEVVPSRPRTRRSKIISGKGAAFSLAFLLTIATVAALAPWIMPYSPTETSTATLEGPSSRHWLGTDELGRDIASRLAHGGRTALTVAFASALIGAVFGVTLGLLSGFFGGWLDSGIMRFLDFLLALPGLLIALVVVTLLGSSTVNLVLAIGVVSVPFFARVVRSSVLSVREREYVVAARAMAASDFDIMTRTVLPNILGPIVVQFVVVVSVAVVVEASLSFLGLGAPPPAPSWGEMLQRAKGFVYQNPWYGVFPGLVLTLVILSLDVLGRGIQRALGTKDIVTTRDRHT